MTTALPDGLDLAETCELVRKALDEDLRYGPDVTTDATVPADAVATASVVARQAGTLAGLDVGLLVLDEVIGPITTACSTAGPTGSGCCPAIRS